MTVQIVMGKFDTVTTLVFANFISMQFLAILIFHILAAMYCNKIHVCRKVLFNWAANFNFNVKNDIEKSKVKRKLSIRVLTCIDFYLAKFNVNKKYGITYGSFGLMTFSTFFKVRKKTKIKLNLFLKY